MTTRISQETKADEKAIHDYIQDLILRKDKEGLKKVIRNPGYTKILSGLEVYKCPECHEDEVSRICVESLTIVSSALEAYAWAMIKKWDNVEGPSFRTDFDQELSLVMCTLISLVNSREYRQAYLLDPNDGLNNTNPKYPLHILAKTS